MNFLKKIGKALASISGAVMGFSPLVQSIFPPSSGAISTVSGELTQVASVITTVEAIGESLALQGVQKLTAAGPLVAQVIIQSSMMVGKKIADQAKFSAACRGIASNMADLLNSLHDSGVQVDSKT